MNALQLRRAGHLSMGFALVAAVVGALSLMSVTSTAYGKEGADDRGGDSRGSDDHGGRGRGSDDGPGDDHGRRHGGHGADDGFSSSSSGLGLRLPLGQVVSDWESQGYRVLDISREDGSVVEMEAITPNGRHVEMYIDTRSNTILQQWLED